MYNHLKGCIVLSSGGTGGHVYPALSLAAELTKRSHKVVVVTDQRGAAFQNSDISHLFTCFIHRGQGRLGFFLKLGSLIKATLRCILFLKKVKPQAVIGFGGYPSIPAVWAAQLLGIPTLIHEQNAVLGRANRLVAWQAKGIAVSFDHVQKMPKNKPVFKTGTPIRDEILKARDQPCSFFDPSTGEQMKGPIRLLIVGGSQGAAVFSCVLPDAFSLLPPHLKERLEISQQCRRDLVEETVQSYKKRGLKAIVEPFFHRMDEQLTNADFVISRAGASTVSEIGVLGKPALFVPYAFAVDDHQTANANEIVKHEAGWVLSESEFIPPTVAALLTAIFTDSIVLEKRSQKIKKLFLSNSVQTLADVLENLIPIKQTIF